jgi:endogenous inhibitor of DNA gyrase (YacG/DUF329 family)
MSHTHTSHIIDDLIKPKTPTGKLQKKCPTCGGTGRSRGIIRGMVEFPGIGSNNNKGKKKPSNPFICERCNGSGMVSLLDPIIM